MRREPDDFGDKELVLIYIARRLKDALALEALFTERSVDYLIEVDNYTGGVVFRSERAGAFFYVPEPDRDRVAMVMREHGWQPQDQ